MQMMNRPALEFLRNFIESRTKHAASTLIRIPALFKVLREEEKQGYSPEILDVCKWMHARGSAVLRSLIVHEGPPPEGLGRQPLGLWNKVRLPYCCRELVLTESGRLEAATVNHS